MQSTSKCKIQDFMSDTGCSKIVWKQTDKNGQWSKAKKKNWHTNAAHKVI